ncbi:MAG: ribonuclease P protein component [Bdellovibrionales bacterium]|nr:ribonuclease P protein component [Bdellovibrionales bacterium]
MSENISENKLKYTLPDNSRIKKRSEFLYVQNNGAKFYSRHFLVIALENCLNTSRIGVTISKKIDKRATMRNRIKRRIKEVFRINRHSLVNNFDIVIIARKNANKLEFRNIEREILGALFHNGLIIKGTLESL